MTKNNQERQEVQEIQQLNWNLDFNIWIEVGGRMFVSILSYISFGSLMKIQQTLTTSLKVISIIIFGIMILWSFNPLINSIKSFKYYEEKEKKERNK